MQAVSRRGFTLIELIATIACVAMLIALLAPTIGLERVRAGLAEPINIADLADVVALVTSFYAGCP